MVDLIENLKQPNTQVRKGSIIIPENFLNNSELLKEFLKTLSPRIDCTWRTNLCVNEVNTEVNLIYGRRLEGNPDGYQYEVPTFREGVKVLYWGLNPEETYPSFVVLETGHIAAPVRYYSRQIFSPIDVIDLKNRALRLQKDKQTLNIRLKGLLLRDRNSLDWKYSGRSVMFMRILSFENIPK